MTVRASSLIICALALGGLSLSASAKESRRPIQVQADASGFVFYLDVDLEGLDLGVGMRPLSSKVLKRIHLNGKAATVRGGVVLPNGKAYLQVANHDEEGRRGETYRYVRVGQRTAASLELDNVAGEAHVTHGRFPSLLSGLKSFDELWLEVKDETAYSAQELAESLPAGQRDRVVVADYMDVREIKDSYDEEFVLKIDGKERVLPLSRPNQGGATGAIGGLGSQGSSKPLVKQQLVLLNSLKQQVHDSLGASTPNVQLVFFDGALMAIDGENLRDKFDANASYFSDK